MKTDKKEEEKFIYIKPEDIIKKIQDATFGIRYEESIKNLVDVFSELFDVIPPDKITLGTETMYNCKNREIFLQDENSFKEDEKNFGRLHAMRALIAQEVAHEMWHHAVCVGRYLKSEHNKTVEFEDKVTYPMFEAEEAGAESIAEFTENLIDKYMFKKERKIIK